ncbi:O-antigen ligase family protein [Patescibacteria group bacterium]|nr:O-antigen ligase family protein [Patescibacteria group bacterium]MBU1075496.1 O-antigen ligase family protein [Patescibacteria group bacterium]MBU1951362.1 O-antigen ligase family protein [Patescibacteria group bacterium]
MSILVNKSSSIIIFGIGAIIVSTLLGWSSRSVWGLAIIEVIILSVLLLAITSLDKKKLKLPIALTAFIFFLILSTVFSAYHYNSILGLVMYTLIIGAFWLVFQFVESGKQFRIIIFTLSAVALIAALNGIVNFFQLQDITLGVASFFGWRNIFAGFILLTLPITLTQFLVEKQRREQTFFGITTVLLAINLYFTFSQASWLAMTIVFILTIWLLRKVPTKQLLTRLLFVIVIITVLIFGLLQLHAPSNGESIQQASAIQSNAVNNRIDYWKTSWEMFTHNPVVGVGIGNFETIYTHFQQNVWSFSVSPHNSILLFLTELGVFGFLVFMFFLFSIVRKARDVFRITIKGNESQYYYSVGIFGGIIASFGHSLVDIDWEIPALLLLWFVEVGLIFALAKSPLGKDTKNLQNTNNNLRFQIFVFVSSLIVGYIIVVPTITDLWNKRMDIIQDDLGDVDDSIALLEKAVNLNSLDADLYGNLSESYQIRILDHKGIREENQYKSAKYARKAVELDPLSAKRHEAFGYALNFISSGEDNEILEAEKELRTAISYNPHNGAYQYQLLGFILQRQEKYDQAIEVLDIALNLFDNENIEKIHADQETHNQLITRVETIKNLRETIVAQMEEE